MHRGYFEENEINTYRDTDKLIDDLINEAKSDQYWEESEYSSDPEYDEVDPEIFEALDMFPLKR